MLVETKQRLDGSFFEKVFGPCKERKENMGKEDVLDVIRIIIVLAVAAMLIWSGDPSSVGNLTPEQAHHARRSVFLFGLGVDLFYIVSLLRSKNGLFWSGILASGIFASTGVLSHYFPYIMGPPDPRQFVFGPYSQDPTMFYHFLTNALIYTPICFIGNYLAIGLVFGAVAGLFALPVYSPRLLCRLLRRPSRRKQRTRPDPTDIFE